MPPPPGREDIPERIKRLFSFFSSDNAKEAIEFIQKASEKNPVEYAASEISALLTGNSPMATLIEQNSPINTDSISRELAKQINSVFSNRGAIEFSETMGAIITEPIISILESYAGKENIDPMEFARSFHGAMILLNMPKAISSIVDIEIAGTKLSNMGDSIEAVYWSLGMGFLGWQTLAPLLTAGLQPNLERYYNAKFHPKRLTLNDMIYLYLVGDIPIAKLNRFIEEEGYPLELTPHIIGNSFRTLNRGELEELYSLGKISKEDIYNQFIKQGYRPAHAAYFRDIVIKGSASEDKEISISKLREAYKKGLRTGSEFRDALELLGYSKEAINLEVELLNYDKLQNRRELSISQLKSAYINKIITKTEVLKELGELGYTLGDVNTLTLTWDAEKKPRVLKLNQGSIIAALNAGVINKSQALARLTELGYLSSEADILVRTAQSSVSKKGFSLSLPMLMQARKINAIGQAEFETWLKVEGLDSDDIKVINALVRFEPTAEITVNNVERALKADVITETQAKEHLQRLGQNRDLIDLNIKTWLAERTTVTPKLTIGTLLLYYRQSILTKPELRRKLEEYGYDDNDIELLLKSADLVLPDDLTRSEIKDLYFTDVIDKTRALTLLKETGLETEKAELLIKEYDVELEKELPVPSIAAYIEALRNDIIKETEFKKKLGELGYDKSAIDLYLKLSKTETKESTKDLSKTDILNAYLKEIFTKAQALERLVKIGYAEADAEILVKLKEPATDDEEE
jgi:hypothetical protein